MYTITLLVQKGLQGPTYRPDLVVEEVVLVAGGLSLARLVEALPDTSTLITPTKPFPAALPTQAIF